MAFRIGIISDTHGLLRPEAVRRLAGVDHIIHGGDIGRPDVIVEFRGIAPVTAIRGNVDKGDWADDYADTELVQLAVTEEEFRWQEYDVLCNAATDPADELFVERRSGKDYGWLGNYVRQVGLVRKLRETRVLTGFSRLMPKSDLSDPAVQRLSIDQTLPWLASRSPMPGTAGSTWPPASFLFGHPGRWRRRSGATARARRRE